MAYVCGRYVQYNDSLLLEVKDVELADSEVYRDRNRKCQTTGSWAGNLIYKGQKRDKA